MRLRVPSLLCVGVLAWAGCGGARGTASSSAGPITESSGSSSANGSAEAHAVVGRSGGTLSLANGARLAIPPGALDQNVDVHFRVGADCHSFGDRERQRALGPVLAIEPGLNASDGQFEVSIPQQPLPGGYSTSDLAFAMEETHDGARAMDTIATQTRWQFYNVSVENGRFVARIDGLPGQRVQFGVAR
jgi:ZU5 domain-containing protein